MVTYLESDKNFDIKVHISFKRIFELKSIKQK